MPTLRVAMVTKNLEFSGKVMGFGTGHGKVMECDKQIPPILLIVVAMQQLVQALAP